jgi:hypothetical protein
MADLTQTQTVPTPVSFDDVSLAHLTFNESFRVTRGAASQVVLGLRNMLTKLSTPTNEYQKSIYPQLSKLTQEVVDRYSTTFLQVTDPVQRQVTGANLNGHRNDGSLYRSVNSGINRSLTYSYAQFGQLLKVLTSRLRFIVNRDVQTVQRYKENSEESAAYSLLQLQSNEFLTYLTSVNDEWTKVVDTARSEHNIQKTTRPPRQPSQTEQTTLHTRQPRRNMQQTTQPQHQHQHQHQQQHHRRPRQQEGAEWVTVRVRRSQREPVQHDQHDQHDGQSNQTNQTTRPVQHHRTRSAFVKNVKKSE